MVAILTGDIIHSRNVPDPALWLDPLKETLNRFGKSPKNWEIFRGDSMQLEVSPDQALLTALQIKATIKTIKNLDIRIAIGIGSKTYEAAGVSESNGEAYVFSGETLEMLKQEKKNLSFRSPWQSLDEEMNIILNLLLVIADNWSTTSAQTALLVLQQPELSQQEMAEKIGISQSSVSARFNRAHLHEILPVIAYFQKRIHGQITKE